MKGTVTSMEVSETAFSRAVGYTPYEKCLSCLQRPSRLGLKGSAS